MNKLIKILELDLQSDLDYEKMFSVNDQRKRIETRFFDAQK